MFIVKLIRRLVQRFKRSGPICSQSLEDFIDFRQSQYPDGICGEENIDGVISSIILSATAYFLPLRYGSFSKAEWGARKGFLEHRLTPSREIVLAQLVNICIRGEDGLVYDPVHLVAIEETSRGFAHPSSSHPCFSSPNYPKATRLEGRTLSLLTRGGACFTIFCLKDCLRLLCTLFLFLILIIFSSMGRLIVFTHYGLKLLESM